VHLKTYAIVNQKGGVGKTTTSVNLAASLAEAGNKVLAVDLDAQANLSAHLGYPTEDPTFEKKSMYDVLRYDTPISDIIVEVDTNLFLAPSSLLLSAADLELGGVIGREQILRKALVSVHDSFDYIIIDCPPSLGLLSLNGLVASSKVIVPVQSEFLALHGVRQLLDTIDQVRSAYNPSLQVGGVLLCLHDARRRLDKTVADTVREYFGDLVFTTIVRTNVALAEAPARGCSILRYDSKCSGADDYRNLAKEVMKNESQISKVRRESAA
jgi:chromosome partitioning protein